MSSAVGEIPVVEGVSEASLTRMFGWRFWWVRSIRTVGRSSPRRPSPSSVLDPSWRCAASCAALSASGSRTGHGPLGPSQRRTALRGGGCLRGSSPAPVISSPGRELRSQRGRVQPARRYYNYLPTLGCKRRSGPARLGGPAGLPAQSPAVDLRHHPGPCTLPLAARPAAPGGEGCKAVCCVPQHGPACSSVPPGGTRVLHG